MASQGSGDPEAGRSKDPVCGMVVVEAQAFGPEESAAGAVWFCSVGCQAQYQAQREGKRKGAVHLPLRGKEQEAEGVEA